MKLRIYLLIPIVACHFLGCATPNLPAGSAPTVAITSPENGTLYSVEDHESSGEVEVDLAADVSTASDASVGSVVWEVQEVGETGWTQVATGEDAQINLRNPGFDDANAGTNARGNYVIQVTVEDSEGRTATDNVSVQMVFPL
jgi:hypothetical protein